MVWVAGVDGFKSEWCLVLRNVDTGELRARALPTVAAVLESPERPSVLCIDIPIGLPEFPPPGGRACEREARRVLGPRASSVFSALGRVALKGSTRLDGSAVD